MSTLKLVKDETLNKIVSAAIDDKVIDGFVSVTQSFDRDKLKATLVVNFDCVEVCTDIVDPDEPEVDPTPVPAPALEATFVAGSVDGATSAIITGQLGEGNHLAYCVADAVLPTPNTGDVAYGTHEYASGNDIAGVSAGMSVGLFELDSTNAIVKFTTHQLMDSDICHVAEALEATFAAGTEAGSTAATISTVLGDGNHYAYKVSDAAVETPNVGDAIEGATEYTSGADITGVDAATNKYVGLYELTADNKAVKFLGHELLETEIGA